jgi:hypothetical protein
VKILLVSSNEEYDGYVTSVGKSRNSYMVARDLREKRPLENP